MLRIAGATHVGSVRRINQDAYAHYHETGRGEALLIVADGLGVHRGGEVASRLAVASLTERIAASNDEPALRMARSIAAANASILKAARQDRTLDGMGTTIVCLLLTEDGSSVVGHVGDSRLYRLRDNRLEGITEDHSLVATLVCEGVLSPEQAREDPRRNQILRALGVRDDIEIEVIPVHTQPGDLYVLCSDGLHGMIDDEEIQRLTSGAADPAAAVGTLIEAANRAGGIDNITCVIASLPEKTMFRKLRSSAGRLVESARSLFQKADR